jgi:2-polyprenyl-6-methoxyphenol hydroxylase-like FAD-dependent oxidoreductase
MAANGQVVIVGAGIAGLTLGLALHARGIACRILERSTAILPLGVGINILPHASRVLHDLGLGEALAAAAVETKEAAFFNRFGQLFYSEPLGRAAGYASPQYSIHRGDLQKILLDAFLARGGRLETDTGCTGFSQTPDAVTLPLARTSTGETMPAMDAVVVVACDGIHSAIRRQIHPDEGEPRYSGVNMWRGTTVMAPILSGATMVRAGWLAHGKMVIYPIRDDVDGEGRQLMNWVAEIETPKRPARRDWNRTGLLADFLPAFADWHFDWLDVPAMIEAAGEIFEFPMVDQDPLDRWTDGRVTLMGDAAHPMVPRGSNGAGQAILDAECLAARLGDHADPREALAAYEAERLDATSRVVLTNRVAPPDIILREIVERTGDRPFDDIDRVISRAELAAFQTRYKEVAGYDLETLRARSGTAVR